MAPPTIRLAVTFFVGAALAWTGLLITSQTTWLRGAGWERADRHHVASADLTRRIDLDNPPLFPSDGGAEEEKNGGAKVGSRPGTESHGRRPNTTGARGIPRIVIGLWSSSDPSRFGAPAAPRPRAARFEQMRKLLEAGFNAFQVSPDWRGSAEIIGGFRAHEAAAGRDPVPDCGAVNNNNTTTTNNSSGSSSGAGTMIDDGGVESQEGSAHRRRCLHVVAVICAGERADEHEASNMLGGTPSRSRARQSRTKARAEVRAALEKVKRVTRSTHVASVMLHWHDHRDDIGLRAAVLELRERGDVGHVGVANLHAHQWETVLPTSLQAAPPIGQAGNDHPNGIGNGNENDHGHPPAEKTQSANQPAHRRDPAVIHNEVPLSIVDDRASAGALKRLSVRTGYRARVFAYGVLCGGLLTDRYLGTPRPADGFVTPSVARHLRMIDLWGGWDKFQSLLAVLREVASRHAASVAEVAIRYALERPYVAGAVVGIRLGVADHTGSLARVFSFELTERDYVEIRTAAAPRQAGKPLLETLGEPGDEFQHHRRVPDLHAHRISSIPRKQEKK